MIQRPESILRDETASVRVTEFRFAAGAETGWHRHGHDYVVVPLTHGTMRIVSATGETHAQLEPGVAYSRSAGVEHNVINAGSAPLIFVELELLEHSG